MGNKYNLSNAQFAGGFAETVQGNQLGGTQHNCTNQTQNIQGDTNMSIDKSQKISVGGDFNIDATNAVVNLRDISGSVTNTIQQLPETSTNEPGIKDLLAQLQTAIEEEIELTDKQKIKALKQVKNLATAGENPEANQDDAEDYLTMLKGLISGLRETASLVITCEKVIPILMGLFGLV